MNLIELYVRGLGLGFAIAAALGPIGLLCIRRTLTEGALAGLTAGLGAATADTLYASVAAFGLTAVSDLVIRGERPLGIAGGAFLILLAAQMLRRPPSMAVATGEAPSRPGGLTTGYVTTLGLTITNPATVVSFAAAFVGFGLAGHEASGAVALVAGVFCGSAAWWAVLAGAVAAFRSRVTPAGLRRLAAASSCLIGGLGAIALGVSLLRG